MLDHALPALHVKPADQLTIPDPAGRELPLRLLMRGQNPPDSEIDEHDLLGTAGGLLAIEHQPHRRTAPDPHVGRVIPAPDRDQVLLDAIRRGDGGSCRPYGKEEIPVDPRDRERAGQRNQPFGLSHWISSLRPTGTPGQASACLIHRTHWQPDIPSVATDRSCMMTSLDDSAVELYPTRVSYDTPTPYVKSPAGFRCRPRLAGWRRPLRRPGRGLNLTAEDARAGWRSAGTCPRVAGSSGVTAARPDGCRAGPLSLFYTSRLLTYFVFRSMNSRRGSTSSAISSSKSFDASAASSMVTRRIVRVSGFMVVSQSWSGFISPRPL